MSASEELCQLDEDILSGLQHLLDLRSEVKTTDSSFNTELRRSSYKCVRILPRAKSVVQIRDPAPSVLDQSSLHDDEMKDCLRRQEQVIDEKTLVWSELEKTIEGLEGLVEDQMAKRRSKDCLSQEDVSLSQEDGFSSHDDSMIHSSSQDDEFYLF